MEEVQQRVHLLAGTDLLGRSSSPSYAAVPLECAQDRPPPLALSHRKHLLEEFNSAVRRSDPHPANSSTPVGTSGGKRKAGMIPLAAEGAEQLVSGGISAAARSANVVHGPKPGDVERDCQEMVDSAARLCFDNTINSDQMDSALGSDVPEREEEEAFSSEANEEVVSISPNVTIRSASSEDDQAVKPHMQVPPPAASGKACDGDEETGPDCSAAEPSASSSSDTDDGGDHDLYDLGVAAAMAMDEATLRSEVARYFSRQTYREQRPQRRAAAQRNAAAANPAPPVKLSLRLSHDEAMEDVAAVSVASHVRLEDALPALPRNAKRRRGS